MPRPDVAAESRSGFWGTVPIPAPLHEGTVELTLAARLSDGREEVVPVGAIPVVRAPESRAAVTPGLIAICLGTYNPELALFRAQVESLRDQTDERWVCVVSDDCSEPDRYDALRAVIGGDRRFSISRSERRLGFYRNFERALSFAPPEAALIALCDQDDRWDREKLAVLRAELGTAQLVYSDQRLVDEEGRVLRSTMWRGRRNNHTNLASLLVANTITGASALFRREVLDLAVPFPDTPGLQFHDHWIGLVALAAGDVAYVGEPLYDYVQHSGAVFGDVTARHRVRRPSTWRGAYFLGYLAREVQAQVLLARLGSRLMPAKRRSLEWFTQAGRSPVAAAWLAGRAARVLTGRNETLASELELIRGIAWRWVVAILARAAVLRRRCDARFPDPLAFEQRRLRRWRSTV
jgi:hypothetical protein